MDSTWPRNGSNRKTNNPVYVAIRLSAHIAIVEAHRSTPLKWKLDPSWGIFKFQAQSFVAYILHIVPAHCASMAQKPDEQWRSSMPLSIPAARSTTPASNASASTRPLFIFAAPPTALAVNASAMMPAPGFTFATRTTAPGFRPVLQMSGPATVTAKQRPAYRRWIGPITDVGSASGIPQPNTPPGLYAAAHAKACMRDHRLPKDPPPAHLVRAAWADKVCIHIHVNI
jgi:hypothetical protein